MFTLLVTLAFLSVGKSGDAEFKKYQKTPGLFSSPSIIGISAPLVYSKGSRYLLAGPVSRESLDRSSVVGKELKLYPQSFLDFSRLKQIIVCNGLFDGSWGQINHQLGLSIHEQNTMLIDSAFAQNELKHGFHHELFHFVDWQSGHITNDPEWLALNETGFRYKLHRSRQPDNHLPGFVSDYATSEACEDKAETFAMLICQPELVARLVAKDAVLSRKVGLLKQRLQLLCPEMDEAFWAKLDKQRSESQFYARTQAVNPQSEKKPMFKDYDEYQKWRMDQALGRIPLTHKGETYETLRAKP